MDSSEYESGVKGATEESSGLITKFQDIAKSSETTNNKIKALASQYSAAKEDVNKLADAFNKSAKENGVTSEETQKLARELQNAENKAAGLKSQLDQMVDSAKKSGDSFGNLGSKLKSGLATAGKAAAVGIGVVTAAAGAAVGGLLALESATEEYRIAQGKLNTAFEAAGMSSETAKEAYRGFYAILGDTDTATEASQLLAQLAENEEDVATWTKISAGVLGTYGDSLPIESLIEAANETAKVGEVTGTLADALNWAGLSEEAFNAQLAACSSESERNQLIMQTLEGTYGEAAEAFYRNNEALIESNLNQEQLNAALAGLGQTVSEIKNRIMADFLPAISGIATALNGMLNGVEGADKDFSDSLQALIDSAVSKLPDFLSLGTQVLASLLSGIIQSIPSLIEAIPQIISEIISALMDLFPKIAESGSELLRQLATGIKNGLPILAEQLPQIIVEFINFVTASLPDIIAQGVEVINALVTGILEGIPVLVESLPEIITSFIDYISTYLPLIIEAGIDILTNLIAGIISAIPQLVAALPEIIMAIVEGIGALLGAIVEVGKVIVSKIWEGIESRFPEFAAFMETAFSTVWETIQKIWDAVEPYFSAVWEGIKTVFSVVADVLGGFFSVAWDAIKGVFSGWKAYFEGLWEDLKGVFSGVWEWFSGIGEDIVNGIKEGISNAWNGLKTFVTNLFDGLYDDVTDNEEIHSPSKKWARIGQADALGLGEGWLDTLAQVKSQIQNDLDFGTSFMSMGQARPAFSYGYGAYPNYFANSSAANTESINITLELDGAVLARKMYTYNRTESKRRGTSLING